MKVHTYILCYNEEEILKNILDYYSTISSRIFLFDNLSSDNSINIASRYSKVTIIPFDTKGKKDNSKHVQIKSQAYKSYSRKSGKFTSEIADWIICVDTDEVIYHPDLKGVLKSYLSEGVSVPQITGFDMVGKEDIKQDISIIEQYNEGVRSEVFDKPAIFHVDFDMSYSKGCHPHGAGHALMKETYGYRTSNQYPIALLHFKEIGRRFFKSSIENLKRFGGLDGIKKDKNNNFYGEGAQYAHYVGKGDGFSPSWNKRSLILSPERVVLFDKYSDSITHKGVLVSSDLERKGIIHEEDINIIRDSAMQLENFNLQQANSLMLIASKLRPNGKGILIKLSEYKEKLEKT